MNYIVMECGICYAIVLDNQGRFLKVVNRSYEVGQRLDEVISFEEKRSLILPIQKKMSSLAAVAACFCVLILGGHQLMLTAYGTVRMQINPDVIITVNRLDYVIDLAGVNRDGEVLIEGYRHFGKKLEKVSDELSALAMEDGFLGDGGFITLTVESAHEKWKSSTEEKLVAELSMHLQDKVDVKLSPSQDEHEDGRNIPSTAESALNPETEAETVWQKVHPAPSSEVSDREDDLDEDSNTDEDDNTDDALNGAGRADNHKDQGGDHDKDSDDRDGDDRDSDDRDSDDKDSANKDPDDIDDGKETSRKNADAVSHDLDPDDSDIEDRDEDEEKEDAEEHQGGDEEKEDGPEDDTEDDD